jgi:hypothetical protein
MGLNRPRRTGLIVSIVSGGVCEMSTLMYEFGRLQCNQPEMVQMFVFNAIIAVAVFREVLRSVCHTG